MASKIQGTAVALVRKVKAGEDPFGAPVYAEERITVEDVLIGQPEAQDVTDEMNLTGKRIAYVLGIPKGDTNDWEDTFVEFFGERFRTIGKPMKGIPANIPLRWGQNVRVERYGKEGEG